MTLHDVVRRRSHRGSISRCIGSFGHVQKFAEPLVGYVGYLKMIVRCCTTSHTTSCDVEAHRTIFVQWTCDDIVRRNWSVGGHFESNITTKLD